MNRAALSFLALLFLVATVSAAPEKLDDRWVYYGDTYEDDGIVYFVEESGDMRKALLYVNDVPYILLTGTCKDDFDNHVKYCITEAAYEDEDKFEQYIKYESGEQLFGFHLITYTLIPELKVTRQIKPDAAYNKKSIITVTLENEGEKDIKNIKYVEEIDDMLLLSAIDGHFEKGNYTYELSQLSAGNSRIFQYAVTPQEYESSSLQPDVTYVYDFIRKEADVKSLSLKISEPFTVTRTKSSSTLGINEKGTYTLRILNKEDLRMHYVVAIALPEGMVVSDLYGLKQIDSQLTREDDVSADADTQMSFSLRTPLTGEYVIKVTVTGYVNGEKITRFYEEKISTKTQKLEPRILFSKTDNTITAGNSATLRLYLLNNEPDASYVDIQGKLTSEFLTKDIAVAVVVAGEEKLIGEYTVIAPAVSSTQNKEFRFNGTYKTREGEQFSFDKKLTVSVNPNIDWFVISHALNTTQAHPGDTVKMTVTVKNIAGTYVFMDVHDVLPPGVLVTSGNNFAEISLEKDESRKTYLYEFTIPLNYDDDTLAVSTIVQEPKSAISQSLTTNISISPPDEVPLPPEKTETPETTLPEEQKSEGFFTRIWNQMKSWFS